MLKLSCGSSFEYHVNTVDVFFIADFFLNFFGTRPLLRLNDERVPTLIIYISSEEEQKDSEKIQRRNWKVCITSPPMFASPDIALVGKFCAVSLARTK